jgi:hypothetical protein
VGQPVTKAPLSNAWLLPWALGLGLSITALARLHHEPSPLSQLASDWPQGLTQLPVSFSASTVVMLCHPRCPCTAASLESLRILLQAAPLGTRCYIVFTVPADASPDWSSAPNWDLARSIPGVTTIADEKGALAARFGALTSGEVAVYSPGGRLRFQGGLTPSRGQTATALTMPDALAALRDDVAAPVQHVYGCELVHSHTQEHTCPPAPQ